MFNVHITCSQDFKERGAFPRLLLVTLPLASLVRTAGVVTEAESMGEAVLSLLDGLPNLPELLVLPATVLFALFTEFCCCCRGCRSVRQPLRGLGEYNVESVLPERKNIYSTTSPAPSACKASPAPPPQRGRLPIILFARGGTLTLLAAAVLLVVPGFRGCQPGR